MKIQQQRSVGSPASPRSRPWWAAPLPRSRSPRLRPRRRLRRLRRPPPRLRRRPRPSRKPARRAGQKPAVVARRPRPSCSSSTRRALDAAAPATSSTARSWCASASSRRSATINVNGHADRLGSPQYNQKLSERRADAVKAYLVKQGATAAKIETYGFGKTLQVKSCPDQKDRKALIECLQPNRRVEVEVLGTAARRGCRLA